MVSALVCMVTYWKRPTVIHDIRPLSSHDFTKVILCVVSQT